MKKQIFFITLGIMIVLGSGLSVTPSAPGDSPSDPKTAFLGDNSGSIATEGVNFYFRFTPTSTDSIYLFSLNGPTGTDFDMVITLESTGSFLGGAYDFTYPDTVRIDNIFGPVIIRVYGVSGTGDFTLTIETGSVVEPTTAFLGDNAGIIANDGDNFYFRFSPSSGSSYTFSLNGPVDTDYDMEITLESTGSFLGGAYSLSYPDTVAIDNVFGPVIIRVYSFGSIGDFTLSIELPSGPDDQIDATATLGDNAGSLDSSSDIFNFRFDPTSGSTYKFSLTGPDNTDFDMDIKDETTGRSMGGLYGSNYPDFTIVGDIVGPIILSIYSYDGGGAFVLNIEAASLLSDISYSSELKEGDIYTWDISFQRNGQSYTEVNDNYGFIDGDVIEIEMLKDGNLISGTIDDSSTNQRLLDSFRISQNGVTLTSDDEAAFLLFILIFPTSYKFEDGTSMGLLEASQEGLVEMPTDGEFTRDGDELVSSNSDSSEGSTETFTIRVDESSGLLNLIDFSGSNATVTDLIVFERQGAPVGGNESISGAGLPLPISPVWVVSSLVVMVFYQRKRK